MYEFRILKAVMDVNLRQKNRLVEKVCNYFGHNLKGKTLAIWGLAFKPNTDDIREAPALHIIDELLELGASIKAYDPEAMHHVKEIYGDNIELTNDQYSALENSDALIIITEWNAFRTPDFEKLASTLNKKIIFDGRNIYSLDTMKNLGFYYESIGRETVHP
jgi:UDPglucose 6-dehydrogenase